MGAYPPPTGPHHGPSNLPRYFLDFDHPEAEEAVEILETKLDLLTTAEAQALYDALEGGELPTAELAAAKAAIASKS